MKRVETKPRIERGMSFKDYLADTACSRSDLLAMIQSPAHCIDAKVNKTDPTKSMKLGTLLHSCILEPESVKKNYCFAPDVDRRTKEGKAEYAEFLRWNKKKIVVPYEHLEIARHVVRAVEHNEFAQSLLRAKGSSEVSIFWTDAETGVRCKIRPDRWRADGIAVDVKSTQDASPEAFAKDIYKYFYHVQAAFYVDGIAATGDTPRAFVFQACETVSPFGIAHYVLDNESMDLGRSVYRKLLATYADCSKSGQWPSYPEAIVPLSLPRYAFSTPKEV